jgi:hypothetical protein
MQHVPCYLIMMQGTATNLVNTGQQLLATSRQLNPQLQQLAAMAEVSKQLRAQAEKMKQISATVLPQCERIRGHQ